MEPRGKAPSLPPPTPAEVEILAVRAGLHLNAGQMADLVVAWKYAVQVAALIPRAVPLADEFAFAFRLPLPEARKPRRRPARAAK